MAHPPFSPDVRAARLAARLPNVPRDVANRMIEHFRDQDFKCRGVPKAMDCFYAHLASVNWPPSQVRPDDFRAVVTSRTGLYALLYGLETFAPDVPLAAARTLRQEYDRHLNATYNARAKMPRASTRIVVEPRDWPEEWRSVLPALSRKIRLDNGTVLRKCAPRTHKSIVQAVGMLAAARNWAADQGVEVAPTFSEELIEAGVQFLHRDRDHGEKSVSPRTAADCLERIRSFGLRGGLLDEATYLFMSIAIAQFRDESEEETPAKVAKVRAFNGKHGLGEILRRSGKLMRAAENLPAHRAEAEKLRRDAVILALLMNGCDRQGDLSQFRISREIRRLEDGKWWLGHRQRKTGGKKEPGALWPCVCQALDAHILGGRPAWTIEERLADLDGVNLLSLENEPLNAYYASAVLRREFGVSGHLIRTLVTDFLRIHRPDAAWAAQQMLGHSNRTMQETYRTDFAEVASIDNVQELLDDLRAAFCER
jgi:hypothetical protein